MATDIPNGVILKNRGFPVELHKVKQNQKTGRYDRVLDDDGEPEFEKYWFRLTNADLAAIEEEPPSGWGSLENWQEALERAPYLTLARTFAVVRDNMKTTPEGLLVPNSRVAGLMLQDGEVMTYLAVVTGALMIAQGIDPERAGENARTMLRDAKKAMQEATEGDDIPTSPTEADSPGPDGSQDGLRSIETSMSSGG